MVLNHSVAESSSKGKQGSGLGFNSCAENIVELLEGEGAVQKFQHRDLGPSRKTELDAFYERALCQNFAVSC